jgi:hypothetical protein
VNYNPIIVIRDALVITSIAPFGRVSTARSGSKRPVYLSDIVSLALSRFSPIQSSPPSPPRDDWLSARPVPLRPRSLGPPEFPPLGGHMGACSWRRDVVERVPAGAARIDRLADLETSGVLSRSRPCRQFANSNRAGARHLSGTPRQTHWPAQH